MNPIGCQDRESIASDGALRIRRMRDDEGEYALLARWLNEPQVREWWGPDDPPATVESVRHEHRPSTRPGAPTTACIIELDGRATGFIQFYEWASCVEDADAVGLVVQPDDWGLDVLIGEPAAIGGGVGPRAVALLCDHLERAHGARSVTLLTEVTNLRAHRAYEKAAFRTIGEVLDTDTRNGERVRSLVMRRARGAAQAPGGV